MDERHTCERASDLIAFLYGEADEREARDFRRHLQQCSSCRDQVASFGSVRESITAWRDEALAGFVSTPVTTQPQRKSALAALRQFFDLSPLWLKGATALAVVAFCVLAGLALFRSDNSNNNNNVTSTNANPGAVYTEQEVNHLLQEALARQQKAQSPPVQPPSRVIVDSRKVKSPRASSSTQFARGLGPLSKAEREQLAAELRLLATGDDATLHLLGDRINQ